MPEYIKIRTARNVEIEYALAGLGDRILGRVIDTLILVGYIFLSAFIMGATGSMVVLFILIIPVFFYSFLFELFNNGQTPGKSILQMRVVSLNGDNVTASMYFTRWVLLLIDIRLVNGVVGIISILVSENAQRLGDIAAGTTVISLKKKSSLRKTAYRKINPNYTPQYPDAIKLKDLDIQTIQQVMRTKSENRRKLISMASTKIEDTYGIVRRDDPHLFLRAIINDYNFYQYHAHKEEYGKYDAKQED